MSYNLDLRSPAYIKRELFQRKKSLLKTIFILMIISPFVVFYGLNHYHQLLVKESASLENELTMLRREAEPLMIMAAELENMEMRKELIDQELDVQNNWSAGLHLLHDNTPAQITIKRVEITPDGLIKIAGTSTNMHAPARYRQKLSDLSAFDLSELNKMILNSEQNYTFNITAQLSMGDEADDNTEEIAAQ